MGSDLSVPAGYKGSTVGLQSIVANNDGTYTVTKNDGTELLVSANGSSIFSDGEPFEEADLSSSSSSSYDETTSVFQTDVSMSMNEDMFSAGATQFAQGLQSQNTGISMNAMDMMQNAYNFFMQSTMNTMTTNHQNSVIAQAASENNGVVPGETEIKDGKTVDELAEECGYRKTYHNGTYYDDSTKTHYRYNNQTKQFEILDADMVYKDGSYKKDGVKYNSKGEKWSESAEGKAEAADKEAKAAEAKAKADEAKAKKIENEAAGLAEDLYDAMKGAGTKNDKLQKTMEKLNKDNVMAVLDAWDSNFSDGMDGESLIESIQGEHHTGWFGHSQEDQENLLVNALVAKAESLGLKNEAHACRAKVNSEHSAWFTSDDTVKAAIQTLIDQIRAKTGSTVVTQAQAKAAAEAQAQAQQTQQQ